MRRHRELKISTAPRRTSTTWTNKLTDKLDLIAQLSQPHTIPTTTTDYHTLPKAQKDELKDVGGYVGGHLKDGRRKKGHVYARSFITLDLDTAPHDLTEQLTKAWTQYAWFATTTASHTPDNPRWRIIVWLTRDVTPDEYAAISRRLAEDLNPGLAWFDSTTYEPERFMYWSAVTEDGDFHTATSPTDIPDLDPDLFLRRISNWHDISTWPGITPDDVRRHQYAGEKVQDPREKPGIIGAFNRAYSIEKAIQTFLPEVYKPGTTKNRWTYTGGSSANGLIIYDGGLHAYSQHATDPASEQMVNAFDLVRIHLYGNLDAQAKPDTPINRLPSTHAMTDHAMADTATKMENARTVAQQMTEVFQPIPTPTPPAGEDTEAETTPQDVFTTLTTEHPQEETPPPGPNLDWLATLTTKRDGTFDDTITNFQTIFTHDPRYNHISWNEHSERLEVQDPHLLPWTQLKPGWTDNDTAQLKTTLATHYNGLYSPTKMHDALTSTAAQRAFHPVREYFTTLPTWDGIPRLDTLLVDYLGADDTDYTRAVTRKTLIAAVRRTHRPGTKFDTVLILVGPQGAGKSTIFSKLAGQWFSDSLTIGDMKDKDGAEKLAGVLIMEIAELAGMRKTDAETLKGFISRTDDKYRPAYGRVVESHPRQGIIVGTTNANTGFLRDPTGGRRFWPVDVTGHGTRHAWDMTHEEIDQIWAEATYYEKEGEQLHLTGDLAAAATQRQAESIETDDRTGLVAEYLDKDLPASWDDLPLGARRQWLTDQTLPSATTTGDAGWWAGMKKRDTVSKIEIWSECFGYPPEDMKRADSYDISTIMSQIPGWDDTGKRARLPIYGLQRVFTRTSNREPTDVTSVCDKPE